MPDYQARKDRLSAQMRAAAGEVRLGKQTTNLFRVRDNAAASRLDVRDFNRVIAVNPEEGWLEAEAMASYADLVDATLPRGVMPAVVPQLKSITIGGAAAGLGIESSSFRYGLAHEAALEMDVLLANGDVVLCTPTNEHSDLFFALPNSFGTLGYALRIRTRTVPVKPYVALTHTRYTDPIAFFRQLDANCRRPDVDFVDGVVFDRGEHYLVLGRFVDEAPRTSDYTYLDIYYRSIRARDRDYLTTHDYLWRWDTDWFWCARLLGAENPVLRRLLGRKRLNSTFYKKVVDWKPGYGLRRAYRRVFGIHHEAIIQDVDVTIDRAPEFLEFFQREIGLKPVWICPFKAYDPGHRYPLFPTRPDALYVNFGFWDSKSSPTEMPAGHFNRMIEAKLADLGGIKSLYSDAFYSREEFRALYSGEVYDGLKARYDPEGRLADVYRKCVLRQ
jgi:FAD/FMN-containing dehydrogenase